jgi:arginine repressor
MVNAEKEKSDNQTYDQQKLLKQYGLTCISPSTVCRWLKVLGFKYEVRKKGYYVNGHEKEGTLEYQWKYVDRYLKREAQMYCWIQITSEEAQVLESENKIPKKTDYRYFDTETGVNMVE